MLVAKVVKFFQTYGFYTVFPAFVTKVRPKYSVTKKVSGLKGRSSRKQLFYQDLRSRGPNRMAGTALR
jgi:hypothetical protein